MKTIFELAEKESERIETERQAREEREQRKQNRIEKNRNLVMDAFCKQLSEWGVSEDGLSVTAEHDHGSYYASIVFTRDDGEAATIEYLRQFEVDDHGVARPSSYPPEIEKPFRVYVSGGIVDTVETLEKAAYTAVTADPIPF
jgi:hypothetical protein